MRPHIDLVPEMLNPPPPSTLLLLHSPFHPPPVALTLPPTVTVVTVTLFSGGQLEQSGMVNRCAGWSPDWGQ
jgi:hypothetical protein